MYFIAINAYRSSTSVGFANTWHIYRCYSAEQRNAILRNGLPVSDCCDADTREPMMSTQGIRVATPAERRQARRDIEIDRNLVPYTQHGLPDCAFLPGGELAASYLNMA